MNIVGELLGEVCKIIFPISDEIHLGNSKSSISICTLSSMNLLKDIASSDIMNNVAIAGRLLSENKGIDQLVRNVIQQNNIKTIFLCGIAGRVFVKDENFHHALFPGAGRHGRISFIHYHL